MIELDCSMGEGGGSIVRISAAIAAAKNVAIKLYNIRKKRPNPGLQMQHIEAIRALQQLSGVSITGVSKGSTIIKISPGSAQKKGIANVKLKTAASVALVAQAVLYYSLLQNTQIQLKITGGATHAKWAPSIDYVRYVTYELLKKMNKKIDVVVDKFGFYPKGGAKCEIIFESCTDLEGINFTEKGILERVDVYSVASLNLKQRNVAERQVKAFINNLDLSVDPNITIKYVDTASPGSGITVVNNYDNGAVMGCFVVGEIKLSAETVGRLCKKQWLQLENSLAPIDEFAADQLIIPMALATNKSKIKTYKLTSHTKTNIILVKKLLKREIRVTKDVDGTFILSTC